MKILFYSTTFQADVQAFAYHLAARPGYEVWVALDDPAGYRSSLVHQFMPFPGELLPRAWYQVPRYRSWHPDLMVVDNHLPRTKLSKKIFVLWHGYGWRVDDLTRMQKELSSHVGDVKRPNPHFGWQAFGDLDRQDRILRNCFDPGNVYALGSAYSDWLLSDSPHKVSWTKQRLQTGYSFDLQRPTVLFAPTWHHAGPIAHWGEERELLPQLFRHIEQLGANLIVRLHDRNRYDRSTLHNWNNTAKKFSHVMLKFKNEEPDSLCDVLSSDIMISNYSSLLNAWYYTAKPSIHILPDVSSGYRRKGLWKTTKNTFRDPSQFWKIPMDEVGGLIAQTWNQLLDQIEQGIANPECCKQKAESFVKKHIEQTDGHTCSRIEHLLSDKILNG